MLSGKTILVTGATSGIGAETARTCAREGATVILSGRNASAGADLVSELAGKNHQFIAADLANATEAQELVGKVISKAGKLDCLINNAGVVHHTAVPDTSDQDWADTIAVNLSAVFYMCRAAIPVMKNQGGGVIVNVASTWGLVGAEQSAAYCASKGGVIQLTRAMAMDHARDNVRINAVAPGAVDTPMLHAEAAEFGLNVDEGRKLWAADAPNQSLAAVEDIAEAVIFLASNKSKHVHGIVLPVDGGSLAG